MTTPTGGAARFRWTLSVRTTMLCLVVAVMLPLLLHLVLLIAHSFATTRGHAEEDRLEKATQAAVDADNRLRMIRTGLVVAAGSTALSMGDLEAFHRELRLAIAAGGLRAAVLFDSDGTVLLHSREPAGTPSQRIASAKELAETVASPGSVGDLAYSQFDGEPLLRTVVRAPVPGGRQGWLSFSIAPDDFATLGASQILAAGEVVTVRDRNGRLLWRTSPHVVGDPLPAGKAEAMARRRSGVLRDIVTPSGETISIGFARAASSGLLVTSSQTLRRLYDDTPFGAHGTVLVAVASVGTSLLLALLLGNYLQSAFRRTAVGNHPFPIVVAEAAELAEELRADRDMLLRSVSRLAVLELTLEHMRSPDTILVHPSANYANVIGAARDRPVTMSALLGSIDAADRPALSRALAGAFADAIPFSLVVRGSHPTDAPRWLNLVGVPDRIGPGRVRRLVLSLEDISGERAAAAVRMANEARLQMATEAAGLGVWEIDLSTGRRFYSARLWALLEMEPRDTGLSHREMMALVHPDDRAKLKAINVVTLQRATDVEFRMVLPARGTRYWSGNTILLRDAAGTPTHVIGVIADVTDQKLAELELQSHSSQLALAATIAEIGIWERDQITGAAHWIKLPEGLQRLNEAGRAPVGQDFLSLIHPDDRARLVREWVDLDPAEIDRMMHAPDGTKLDTSPRQEIEFRGLGADGGIRHIQAKRVFLRGPSGDISRSVGVFADITERRSAQQAIADRETRLRLAVDATGLGMTTFDLRTSAIVRSERLQEILGLPATPEDLALPLDPMTIHPEDRDAAVAERDEWIGQGAHGRHHATYRILHSDGSVRHMEILRTAERDTDGRPTLVVAAVRDVTEAHTAAQALRDNETRFRLASDAADLGIWDLDLRSGLRVWSDRMWTLHGWQPRPDPPTLDDLLAVVLAEDHGVIRSAWADASGDRDMVEYEYRIRLPSGEVRHISRRGNTVRDSDGTPLRITGVSADVTERGLAAARLRDSETRFRLATEAAELGIWDIEMKTGERVTSARFWHSLGLVPRSGAPTREELLAIVLPEDHAALQAAWADIAAGKDIIAYEYRVRLPGGDVRHIHGQGRSIREADRTLLRITGISADVTATRVAAQALAESEARFRLAIEAAELGVWDYDPATGETAWSARMWEIRGRPAADAPVTIEDIGATTHPADRDHVVATVRAQWAGQRPGASDSEYRVLLPDGTERIVMSRSVAIHDAAGQLVQVIGVNRDITREREAEIKLRENEALFRLAIETAALGVYQMNIPARDGVWSDRMYAMRGLDPRPGMPPIDEMMEMVHPDDREMLLAHRMAHRVRASGSVSEYEFRVVWPDGTVRHLLARAFPMRDEEGTVRKIIGVNQDITEQRRVEQELRDNAIRYELATRAAGLAVWELLVPSGERRWSPEMWAQRGLPPGQASPTEAEALAATHPDDRAMHLAGLNQLRANPGEPFESRHRIIRADGAVRHIHIKTTALRDARGEVVRITGVAADVTEATLAQRTMEESEARFRLAAETAELGVWQINVQTREAIWSDRMWTIRGLARAPRAPDLEEAIAFCHPDDRERVGRLVERFLQGTDNGVLEIDFRIVRPDGAIRTIRSKAMTMIVGEHAERVVLGVNLDVTERLAAEHALRESESLFRLAAEAASQGIWDEDRRTRQVRWSQRMWLIHGLEPREVAPSRAEWDSTLHADDRAKVMAMFAALRAVPTNYVRGVEYRIFRPDGTIRHLDTRAMTVHDDEGKLVRLIGVVVDVTEVQELRAQAAIAGNLATLGQLAGGIAHELAQPLQAIMAASDSAALMLGRADDGRTRDYANARLAWISTQAERAGKTIQHLLAFSRGGVSGGSTNIAEAIDGALELVGRSLDQARISIAIDIPQDPIPVLGSTVEIEQVLVNLLLNARDALDGKAERQIRIDCRRQDGMVVLNVTDSGGGIPAAALSRVFDPFFTTKPPGKGTGLGLSIVQKTMAAVGGTVTVRNTAAGAMFSLCFQSAELPE